MINLRQCNISHRGDLAWVLGTFHQTGLAVEVGVQWGDYSDQLLNAWGGHLVLVDAWRHFATDYNADPANVSDGEHLTRMVHTARRFLHHEQVSIIRGLSASVARLFADGSLDFVYLDANHSRDMVALDIAAWKPKVRTGGVLAGHDWGARENEGWGVRPAVLEHFTESRVLVTKDPYPSWAVVKETQDD